MNSSWARETFQDQTNKCVSVPWSSKPAAARPCPMERARLRPGRDSPQVALAAVCGADVVPEIWHFSAVMERVHQPCRHGGVALPAHAAAPFPIPGAVLARPAQDSWPGCGEARSCCRGRLRQDVMGLVSRARTRSSPFPPFWLEHAAPTPPRGPGGTDTTVNRGRRGPARPGSLPEPPRRRARHDVPSSPAPGRAPAKQNSPDSPYQLERRGRTRPAVPEHPPSPVAAVAARARLPPGCSGHGTGLLVGAFTGSAAEPSVERPAWE